MGAVNYGTSEYITIGYNCNTEYVFDDFWTDANEQRNFEIAFLRDEVAAELSKYSFYYFHVAIKSGYYEGFYIDIENNFSVALGSWEDRQEMQKEITEIKRFLTACADLGLVECFPGWCTGYSAYDDTIKAIRAATKEMRLDAKSTPTIAQYERARA